jgi:hypothetical protein
MSSDIISSYPNVEQKPLVTTISLFLIRLGWFTYKKSAEIINRTLLVKWHMFYLVVFKKEISIETFDSIFVQVKRLSNYNDGASSGTTFYAVTLADSLAFNLDTGVVTPSIYKKVYSISDHYNFNKRTKIVSKNA